MPSSLVRMSDDSVKKATGKTWLQWFKILDRFPKEKTHTERARWLYTKHLKKGWWCQMVTVTYEQARLGRKLHQVVGGFQVGASKTFNASAAKIFRAWTNAKTRATWLPKAPMTITKATPGKSIRISWENGKSRVDVGLYAKGKDKARVTIQQERLPNVKAAKRMQAYWLKALKRLSILFFSFNPFGNQETGNARQANKSCF